MSWKENRSIKKEKLYGQFFTPPLVADFMIRFALTFLDRRERAIDPACGDGVFLAKLINAGFREVWGVDIDPHVLTMLTVNVKEKAKILITDALSRGGLLGTSIPESYFDLVVGNPPFSSKYGRVSDTRLLQYELGRGRSSQAIEVLFLERFIQLARKDGVIGIILPEGIFASKSLVDVRKFILKYRVLAVVSLPRGVFRGSLSTSSKTHILFLKKAPNNDENVLMIETNSLVELEGNIDDFLKRGISVKPQVENLTPRFYLSMNNSINLETHGPEVKSLNELVVEIVVGAKKQFVEKACSNNRGIRYISSKVVTHLGLDFTRDARFIKSGSHMDDPRAYVKQGDILFVRVGAGCSGRACVVVDENDFGIADDWIYIIRLKDREYLPYYVAIYMQSKPGRMQIERMKRGVGTVNIPKTELLKLRLPIPPKHVLEKIKEKYIGMVTKLRLGDRVGAEKIFNELLNMVEKNIMYC